MSQTKPYIIGWKLAEGILATGQLFYNSSTKANFFRGIMRGLLNNDWMIRIAKEWLKDLGEIK